MSSHFSLKEFLPRVITIELEDKEIRVRTVTDDLMREIDSVNSMNLNQAEILNLQLSIFTGEEPSLFASLDFQRKRAIINHIIDNLDNPVR